MLPWSLDNKCQSTKATGSTYESTTLAKCAAFFDQFFSWSFWLSSMLRQLVVLHWVALCCILLSLLYCAVLCCVVICLLFVSLVCWLKISQFSCTFVARLHATTRRTDNGSISSTNLTTVRPTRRLATKGNPKILVQFSL